MLCFPSLLLSSFGPPIFLIFSLCQCPSLWCIPPRYGRASGKEESEIQPKKKEKRMRGKSHMVAYIGVPSAISLILVNTSTKYRRVESTEKILDEEYHKASEIDRRTRWRFGNHWIHEAVMCVYASERRETACVYACVWCWAIKEFTLFIYTLQLFTLLSTDAGRPLACTLDTFS